MSKETGQSMDKDLIVVLYASNGKPGENLEPFSKSNGFRLNLCEEFSLISQKAVQIPPDMILIETHSLEISEFLERTIADIESQLKFRPAIFLILYQYPDQDQRLDYLRKGISDFLMSPINFEEIKLKFDIYKNCKDLMQKNQLQKNKLKKAFAYLDQFKSDLQITKDTLFEERDTLNNALKQVNQMTQERNRLKKETKEIKSTLAENIEGFCELLSHLIESRIEKNKGHGERVSHIAYFIAKQLDFNEKKLEDLRKAAMLHEAGLLLVPEETLNRSENEWSDYEKNLMSDYPVRGAEFFLRCSEFRGCAEIIKSMNENSDGTGRPEGLKRRYIPLLSRILAGADVFDTLKDSADVNNLEIFLERLEKYAGSRLDPNIVAWLEKYAVLHMGSDDYRIKGVGVHQLKPGMTLATALFTHTGTKLFSVNTLLSQDSIDKIRQYNKEYPVDETVYVRA